MQSARNGMQRWLLGAYAAKIYGYAEEPAQRAAQPRSGASRTGSLQQTICAGGRVLIFQIACRVQSVGLCGLDQRIDHCADLRAKRRIAEQPVLSPNGKRTYRALCAVVGQLQPSAAGNVHQPALLPQGITKRCAIETLWHRIFLIFRLRPPEKFLCNWLGLLLPLRISLFWRKCLLCPDRTAARQPAGRLPAMSASRAGNMQSLNQ